MFMLLNSESFLMQLLRLMVGLLVKACEIMRAVALLCNLLLANQLSIEQASFSSISGFMVLPVVFLVSTHEAHPMHTHAHACTRMHTHAHACTRMYMEVCILVVACMTKF